MRKIYQKPQIEVEYWMGNISILEGSPTRSAGGDPTTTSGKTLSGSIWETDGEIDPYAGHGQGSNGMTNRSNESNLWDD